MLHRKIGCVSLALLLQACATPPGYTPMTSQTQNAIKSLDAYHVVMQDEVRPAVDVSNVSGALGGGLLAAAIDSSINDDRANDARNITDKFYFVTEDINYRTLIAQSVNPVLTQFRHKNPKPAAEAMVLRDDQIKQRVAALKAGEAFMFLTSHYAFMDNFKVLQTATTAYLYVGTGAKMDYTKASYMNSFIYQSPTIGNGGESSVQLWSADNGKLFRVQLEKSLADLQSNMRYDMQPLVKESCLATMNFEFPNQLGTQKLTAKTVKTVGDSSLLRAEDGALYSVATVKLTPAKKNICGV